MECFFVGIRRRLFHKSEYKGQQVIKKEEAEPLSVSSLPHHHTAALPDLYLNGFGFCSFGFFEH